ncbi:hypothetical protein [Marinilactibacillus psychrotolerans]|uniref:hypothetical protein n=1 Tax=Marinilactibacillus psychrotolerans TaxID=191770 RepID=UPI003888DE73
MFFKETYKIFFKENTSDALWVIFGLIIMLTSANLTINGSSVIFFIGMMLLATSMFRLILVNHNFANNDLPKLNKNNVIDFIVSKNAFTFLFIVMILTLTTLSSSVLDKQFLNFSFFFKALAYTLFILGTENIIYIIHNRTIQGYAGGYKRDAAADIQVGVKGIIDRIPSFIFILFFSLLFFSIDYTPSIYMALYYWLVCMIMLIYFKKS